MSRRVDRGCAPRAGGAVPRCRSRLPRARRAHPGRPCARDGSHGAGGRGGAAARRERRSRHCGAARRAGSPANRSRASSARRNSGGCRFIVTPAVLVPRPETETVVELALALIDQRRRAHARAAHRRSRHRLGRDPARIAVASCRTPAASAPTSTRRRSRSRGAMPKRLGLAARATFLRERLRQRAARPVRSRRVEPALHREPRHRRARAARCATTIRRMRSTAARTGLRPIGRSPPMRRACSRQAASWWSRSAPGQQRDVERLLIQGGLAIDAVAARPLGYWRAPLRPLARPHR